MGRPLAYGPKCVAILVAQTSDPLFPRELKRTGCETVQSAKTRKGVQVGDGGRGEKSARCGMYAARGAATGDEERGVVGSLRQQMSCT